MDDYYDANEKSYQKDSVYISFSDTLNYLSKRYDVRLSFNHIESPTSKKSTDILYKVSNKTKDIMWIYYIKSKSGNIHYVSVETEPDYVRGFDDVADKFENVITREYFPRLKLIFTNYDVISDSLVKMCDYIDDYFG